MPGRLDLLGRSRGGDAASDRALGDGPSATRPNGEATGPGWRPDALAASRHSRLDPGATADARGRGIGTATSAEILCADICRRMLGDLAPAMILLGRAERRRAQAIGAWTLTLFDFARQRSVEGERLAEINRWEFALEAALAGPPDERADAGRGSGERSPQPVFARLAAEHRRRPFEPDAFDQVLSAARLRVTAAATGSPDGGEGALEAEWTARLASGLLRLLVGSEPPAGLRRLTAGLIALGAAAERRTAGARTGWRVAGAGAADLDAALESLPVPYRRAARYLVAAGGEIAEALERRTEAPSDEGEPAPLLGVARRLRLLAVARLGIGWRPAPRREGEAP